MSTNLFALLSTADLTIGYLHHTRSGRDQRVVAAQINLSLRAGELTCLIGPNGAGKSTLLRTLAGMQKPLSGTVHLHPSPKSKEATQAPFDLHQLAPVDLARRLAVVLTERVDVGNLSVYTLVGLGRHPYTDWHGRLTPQDEAVVERSLAQVGATALATRPVSELSDGERQRVMIARALAQQPEVLILDEPTAFLDLPRRVEMMQLLARLAREVRCAILLSTHDLDLALRIADTLWLMPPNGVIYAGLPEEMVLNGTLAQTFQSDGVDFDSSTGTFKLHRHPCGPIGLQGEGLVCEWTGRALERIGYQVVRNGATLAAPAIVEVSGEGEVSLWRVRWQEQVEEYRSLEELIRRVSMP